jgi:FMN phosphatase YigB (HAD superfamily)
VRNSLIILLYYSSDELLMYSDYQGAKNVGMSAVLLRRRGYEYDVSEDEEDLSGAEVVHSLDEVLEIVRAPG